MSAPLDERLAAYLDAAWGRGLVWGEADCLLFAANWCVIAGTPDPAAAFRGRYRTRLGAVRLLNKAGGLAALAARQMAAAGFAEVEAARLGDVGLVEVITPEGPGPVGAVFDGAGWNVLAVGGLAVGAFRQLQAWGVACRSS